MAGESVAERPKGGNQLVTRPFVGWQQDFIDGQRLCIDDEVVVLLQQLRNQRRAATRDMKYEPCRRGISGGLADVLPGDLNNCFRYRESRDRFLHECVLEFCRIDLPERKIQAGWVKGCTRRQHAPLNLVHVPKRA